MPYFPQNKKDFNSLRHLMLLYGAAGSPWTAEELKYYVAHCRPDGAEDDWLYDSFLFLNPKAGSGRDYCADVNLGTTMCGEGDFFAMVSPRPAGKADWEALLDFYFGEGGALDALDAAIDKALPAIGRPYGAKRNAVLMLPYPHLTQEDFGGLGGPSLDFSVKKQNLAKATAQRLAAEKWFVDEIVRRFAARRPRHVHLLGVYWMFESVYRSWEVDDHWLLKELRGHVNSRGLKFLWIPFWSSYNVNLLGPCRETYFDLAFLQSNYMFYSGIRGVGPAARAARRHNAGLEMEYYLELPEPIKVQSERHARFRDYLNGGVLYGYMTGAACAHFQGVGSLKRMFSHPDPQEREFYDDIYHFVKGDYRPKPALSRSSGAGAACALALDLGGTNLRAAIVTETGEILKRLGADTPAGRDAILEKMAAMLAGLKAEAGELGLAVKGVGVSTGGRVDFERGVVADSNALLPGWLDVPLRDLLAAATGLEVKVDNDGNCAALAERAFGAGRASSDFISLVLGTGVGGGAVVNGELLRGADNAAAELGHLTIDGGGPPCSCGGRGCVELYASGSGLARLSGGRLTARELGEAAARGDKAALELIGNAGTALGIAAAGLINAFNPERVILSGSLLKLGEPYLKPLREAALGRAMKTARSSVELVVSELEEPALLGAAALILE
ncbi:MAG: ROK family protein [Elusimicrobiota bacterium]